MVDSSATGKEHENNMLFPRGCKITHLETEFKTGLTYRYLLIRDVQNVNGWSVTLRFGRNFKITWFKSIQAKFLRQFDQIGSFLKIWMEFPWWTC